MTTTDPPRRTTGAQQGPRATDVVERVRSATLDELSRVGFAGMTIDSVARRAGVNRTTIYRRWASKLELVTLSIEPLRARLAEGPETGAVREDLLELMRRVSIDAGLPGWQALAAAVRSGAPELQPLVDGLSDAAAAPFHRALDEAVERGELGAADDPAMIAHLAFWAVTRWEENSPDHRPPGDGDLRRILAVVLPTR